MAQTKIEWTDRVWNPVTGCMKISSGCKNCYAETISKRFWGDRKFSDIICHEDRLQEPYHWKKPQKVFVNSMSDLFHEEVDFDFIDKVFQVMYAKTKHTFQILTKRPKRMLEYISGNAFLRISPLPNVWLGVSIENQETANERILSLLKTPAKIRWVSAEPLLESIDIEGFLYSSPTTSRLDWVVCGGESGISSRPIKKQWVESLYNQCRTNAVPFFFKQWGGRKPKFTGSLLNGSEVKEFPCTA